MLAISFTGFLYKLVTGAALSWTYSLARLFMPWIGMLSITVAFKRGEHVAMGGCWSGCRRASGCGSPTPTSRSSALLALLLVWYGWEFFISTTHYYMVSDQIQIHNRFVAACMPVTGLIMLAHLASGLHLLDLADAEAEADALVRGEAD